MTVTSVSLFALDRLQGLSFGPRGDQNWSSGRGMARVSSVLPKSTTGAGKLFQEWTPDTGLQQNPPGQSCRPDGPVDRDA